MIVGPKLKKDDKVFLPRYKCAKVSIGQSNAEKSHADRNLHAVACSSLKEAMIQFTMPS